MNNTQLLLEQYQEAVEKSSIVSKSDTKGIITYVNDKFCEISGYTKEELIGSNHSIVRHPDTSKEVFKELWKTITSGKVWQGIIKNKTKNSETYYVISHIFPIKDENGKIVEFLSMRQDITSFIKNQEMLQEYSVDSLTGLPNRQKLLLDIKKSHKEVLIILIDIKNFSYINELYGEKEGDSILLQISKELATYIQDENVFLYKINSDKYVIAAYDEKLFTKYKSIAKFSIVQEGFTTLQNVNISFTIGVSTNREKGINQANIALKNAKKTNQNYCEYEHTEESEKTQQKNINMLKTFKNSLEKNLMTPYLQPIVDSKTFEIKKYEALARMIDEKGKIFSPYDFMQTARQSTLFNGFTRQIIQKIFTISQKNSIDVTINLTYENITSKEITTYIENRLKMHSGGQITFEILESEAIEDYTTIKNFISLVKEYNCLVAIDDFGSGYSNFTHLVELNADFIKIDGSIIQKLDLNSNAEIITRSIVDFAKRANIKTIAEFVSSKEIAQKAIQIGIDMLQGYHFGKAEPVEFYHFKN